MIKKMIFRLSVTFNVLVILASVLLFFKLGGLVYFENRIANALSDEPSVNPIVEIRNDNLKLVGEREKDIVFVGDSHTNYFEWGEYFFELDVANRGIGSDTSDGVLKRVDSILKLKPKKTFIMVGVNDIQQGVAIDDISRNYREIIQRLKTNNPDGEIYVQSVLPISGKLYERNFYKQAGQVNEIVKSLNEVLAKLEGVTYVDIAKNFGDELPEEYTTDGIHLNKKGYEVWLNTIEGFVID